ncbi:MAG: ORF6N domain-containing protein [Betaproteobacteria bacterium]|nr:ORF6N domain-containing protein [Betaproteobacteria bacterium]
MPSLVVPTPLVGRIQSIRGTRVMLDADLAELYGVSTKRFNEQVRRNLDRFPVDFMFQLTSAEKREVVANCDHLSKLKYSPHLPYAFTEHGAIMAATILNAPKAVEMSVFVVRAFVELREILSTHRELAAKLTELEHKVSSHDQALAGVIDAIRQLMSPPNPKKRPIGFTVDLEKDA